MTAAQLAQAVGCHKDRAAKWLPFLLEAMHRFGISGINERATFLSQIAHESAHLSRFEEGLNYSSEGLAATWPARYRDPATKKPNRLALMLNRKPMAIANNCYANRMGNGDEASGDGWRYRGRGPIQITGRRMYELCGIAIGVPDLVDKPERLLEPRIGALSAGFFWDYAGLDRVDDDLDIVADTKLINGGLNGLKERKALFTKALNALKAGV